MASDRIGDELHKGDTVIIRGRVTQVSGEFVRVETEELDDTGAASFMHLQGKQVEKTEAWPVERPVGSKQ